MPMPALYSGLSPGWSKGISTFPHSTASAWLRSTGFAKSTDAVQPEPMSPMVSCPKAAST